MDYTTVSSSGYFGFNGISWVRLEEFWHPYFMVKCLIEFVEKEAK
jgi:hypothetical protein